METKLEELERRLALAEHQVKALCRVGRALGGLALAVLVVALTTTARGAKMQPAGHIVRAPFRVVDSRGKTLLCVEATAGGGELNVFGQDGKLGASLDADSHAGGSLIILDSRGEIVASLGAGRRSEQGRQVAGYGELTPTVRAFYRHLSKFVRRHKARNAHSDGNTAKVRIPVR